MSKYSLDRKPYFPKPTPAERTSMPIHSHPGTDYVKRHFNEPLGRYETYYIAEAYEGANTWMGFKVAIEDKDRFKVPIVLNFDIFTDSQSQFEETELS